MSGVKYAAFTVRGSLDQSARWKRVAEGEGYSSVGAWLAFAADSYLKMRARSGRPLPLAWHLGKFPVRLIVGGDTEVKGLISQPFGYYHGDEVGPHNNRSRTLVHIPSKRIVAVMRSAAQCRFLASEMAPLLIRDETAAFRLADQRQKESV
ncbi:MAG TPA: hypothetical protein VGS22_23770 [Thermoanaerobaculia bacterium]|nr:hypothetical protein [Thermoanaerobaculia bacterium]